MGNIHVELSELWTDVVLRIPYLQLWLPLQWTGTICAILEEGIMRINPVKLFLIGPVVQEVMSFKCISYLELWQPFCSAERNHFCNFDRGYQEEQFCNHYEFGSVVKMSCKRFLIWSFDDPPVQWSQTIYAVLKEGIIGNIHVKLYEIRTSGSGEDVV